MEDKLEQIDSKYKILQKIGIGGQSNLFLVEEKETNLIYVAKVPKKENDSNFSSEIEVLYSLKKANSPYVIRIINSGEGDIIRKNRETLKKKYIILEHGPKHDLGEYIRFPQEGFGERKSKLIFYNILQGIECCHKNGICHRDIKPSNILLDENYSVKISDFGYASEYDPKGPKLKGNIGTRQYKAPEVIANKEYDGFKVDIFSLGVTLFVLTFYVNGFTEARKEDTLYQKIMVEKPDWYWNSIGQLSKTMSEEFKDLYYKMVSFKYYKRPTIEEVLNHNWFLEIKNMNKEQLNELENEIKEDFKIREKKVEECSKIEITKKRQEFNDSLRTKSMTDENNFFENDIKPKYLNDTNNIDYYSIKIKGNLNPVKFMNFFCHKIFKEFGVDKCFLDIDKNKLKFNVTFDVGEEFKDEIPEEIKEELKKLEINDEIKEEEEDEESNILTIKVKLYKISDGHLLKFIKKKGNKTDFINKFEILIKFVKSIINF